MFEFSSLAVGEHLPPRTYGVDQEMIDRYAQVSGDHNPLHTDPGFAATTSFGRTIAHGMMTLCFLSDSMEAWVGGDWTKSGALEVAFLAPVYPNETVLVSVEVARKEGAQIICKATCFAAERTVMAGEVSVTINEAKGTGYEEA